MIRRLVVVLAAAATCAAAPAALAAAAASPAPRTSRLEGEFVMSGTVTTAFHVRGEHKGEKVTRRWTFTPTCATGACPTVQLVRRRRHATDQVTLTSTNPGYYSGSGVFYAPLSCGGKTYTKGESVPFTIHVHITAAALIGGVARATRIRATYKNRSRHNLTNCVAIPGHDAARYTGGLAQSGGGFPL